jgi:hypothetical protein
MNINNRRITNDQTTSQPLLHDTEMDYYTKGLPMIFKTLDECIEKSLDLKWLQMNALNDGGYDCKNIILEEENKEYRPYTVYIAYRDLLFQCKDASLNYDVNTINGRNSLSLFNIDRD